MLMMILTVVAVFVGTASLCAGIGFSLHKKTFEDPLDRLTKFYRLAPVESEPSRVVKQTWISIDQYKLSDFWRQLGLNPKSLAVWLEQAALPMAGHWVLALGAGGIVVMFVAAKILGLSWAFYPLILLLGIGVPLAGIYWRRKQQLRLFCEQFVDAMELMASALRSGNTIQSALQIVAEELPAPISREFSLTSESVRLGLPVEEALAELAQRHAHNADLQFFVTAVAMQRQCGGNLAEILDKISFLVRERFYIQGQVQALTGEGRLSGVVLMALPVVLFFAVNHLNPEYASLLFSEPMGRKMLAAAGLLQLAGALAIHRIVNFKI